MVMYLYRLSSAICFLYLAQGTTTIESVPSTIIQGESASITCTDPSIADIEKYNATSSTNFTIIVSCFIQFFPCSLSTFGEQYTGTHAINTSASVHIANVSRDRDGGMWRCTGTGGVTDTIDIDVKVPVPFVNIISNNNLIFTDGTNTNVSCMSGESYPHANITWSINGGNNPGSGTTSNNSDGTTTSILQYTADKSDDNKILQCTATNGYGPDKTDSITLNITSLPKVHIEPITSPYKVIEGRQLVLNCSVDRANPSVSSNGFTWRKNGIDVTGQSSNIYKVKPVQISDNGSYTCTGTDSVGPGTSTPVQVDVLYPPIVSTPSTYQVIESTDLTLQCSATANPANINYRWTGPDGLNSTGSSLVVPNIGKDKSGVYSCTATNIMIPTALPQETGRGTNTTTVSILYGPTVTISPDNITTIREHADHRLTCTVQSNPTPASFTWHLPNGTSIPGDRELVISKRDQGGIYRCEANTTLVPTVGSPITRSDSTTINITVLCFCPEKTITSNYTGVNVEYRIPETIHGQNWETDDICVVDGAPIGIVKCVDAVWSKMVFNENCNFQESLTSSFTTNLSAITQSNLTDNVEKILVKVQALTSVPDELTPLDVIYTTVILDSLSKTDNITQQDAINFINIISNIQNSEEQVVTEANEKVNISNKLIASLDELELRIPTDEDDGHFRSVTNNTVVEVWNLAKLKRNPIIGLSLNGEDSDPVGLFENNSLSPLSEEIKLMYNTTDVGIMLNEQFVRRTIEEANTTDIRVSMHILSSDNMFINNNKVTVNSKVISATLTIDRKPVVDLNGSFVTTVFFPQVLPKKYKEKYSPCVFWDLSLNNSRGGWSNVGCRYSNSIEGRDVCVCDHLTNFAIILNYYGQGYLVQPSHQQALTLITYIGLILSIIGLGLTVLTFSFFKKLRKRRPQQLMFNLALAMLFSWIVFLAGVEQTGDHVCCIVVAVLLHYFIMASFMWMLMEGILQYVLFVKALRTHVRNFMLKVTIPAWGVPVIPVAIMLAYDVELYYGGESYCWMGLQGMYYGFALPLGLIMLANSIIYILVTRTICNRKNLNSTFLQHSVSNIRASFCAFIFLGLTWIFGFLAISDARLVFQYIFTVLNSLQGFLIFILFTARDKKVRDYWKQLCCCCRITRTISKAVSSIKR